MYLQKEREEMAREKIMNKVELTLQIIKANEAAKTQDFQIALENAVT